MSSHAQYHLIGKNAFTLASASKILALVKATTPEVIFDKNIGTEEYADYWPTQYCYRSVYS